MGAIQQKRGSVRQAPPTIWQPFIGGDESTNEVDWSEPLKIGKAWIIIIAVMTIVGLIVLVIEDTTGFKIGS
jgi:hypothetical protein